jgi:hypothetical protein
MFLCNTNLEIILLKTSKVFFLLILFLSTCIKAQNEVPELITDRPDQTESAVAIQVGSYQIETGISFQGQKFTEGGLDLENQNISLLNTLFRYGVNSNFEVRFGGGYFASLTRISDNNFTDQGVGDLMLGVKYIFRKDENVITNFGVLFETLLPFGAEQFRPEKFEPKLLFLIEQELSDNFNLGVNFGGEYSSAEERYSYDYSTTLGIGLTKRLGGFVEFYGQTSRDKNGKNFFDCGLTYQQTQNIQLDFSIGSVITSGAQDYFIGFGFSIRFLD